MSVALPEEGVLAARDRYLAENGLDMAEYTAPRFAVPVLRWTVRLPNPTQRQASVAFHDLHHVATGYATDFIGETEISAWEVGAGLGGLWITWAICIPVALLGLVASPKRVLSAYRTGRHCRSLFADGTSYEELLTLTVRELRTRIGLPERGLAPAV